MWRGWWGSWCEGVAYGCPGHPPLVSLRCTRAPLRWREGGVRLPSLCRRCGEGWRGMWWSAVPPVRLGHAAAWLLRLHASPFAGSEGGRGWWRSAVPPVRPGHTPLTAFAPLSSGTKGAYAAAPLRRGCGFLPSQE